MLQCRSDIAARVIRFHSKFTVHISITFRLIGTASTPVFLTSFNSIGPLASEIENDFQKCIVGCCIGAWELLISPAKF